MKMFYPAVIGGWLLVGLGAHALAADLAPLYKAKPLAYPIAGQGCYFGINVEAGAAQTDMSGNALFVTSLAGGRLMAAGGSVGGTVGCIKGDATRWFAVQASINYQNISGQVGVVDPNGASLGTVGVQSKWSAEQVVKFGGLQALFSFLPNLGLDFPVLTPPSITGTNFAINAAIARPYFMVGVKEFDASGWISNVTGHSIGVAPLIGMGMINPMVDSTGALNGAALDVYAKVAFPGRGFSIDNFGGQFNVNGAANMGTQYTAGMAVYY